MRSYKIYDTLDILLTLFHQTLAIQNKYVERIIIVLKTDHDKCDKGEYLVCSIQ